jgi:hypothetical protein
MGEENDTGEEGEVHGGTNSIWPHPWTDKEWKRNIEERKE